MSKLLISNGYEGDYLEDSQVTMYYSTFKKTGARHDLSSEDDEPIEVYKDDNETPITAGIQNTYNFRGAVGVNRVVIDLSASGSYANARNYVVTRLNTEIDGETLHAIIGTFSIGNRV